MPRCRLGPSDRPKAWTPFVLCNGCSTAVPSDLGTVRLRPGYRESSTESPMNRGWINDCTSCQPPVSMAISAGGTSPMTNPMFGMKLVMNANTPHSTTRGTPHDRQRGTVEHRHDQPEHRGDHEVATGTGHESLQRDHVRALGPDHVHPATSRSGSRGTVGCSKPSSVVASSPSWRCCRRCARRTRSPRTDRLDQHAEEHIRSIYSKLGVSRRRCAVLPPMSMA